MTEALRLIPIPLFMFFCGYWFPRMCQGNNESVLLWVRTNKIWDTVETTFHITLVHFKKKLPTKQEHRPTLLAKLRPLPSVKVQAAGTLPRDQLPFQEPRKPGSKFSPKNVPAQGVVLFSGPGFFRGSSVIGCVPIDIIKMLLAKFASFLLKRPELFQTKQAQSSSVWAEDTEQPNRCH